MELEYHDIKKSLRKRKLRKIKNHFHIIALILFMQLLVLLVYCRDDLNMIMRLFLFPPPNITTEFIELKRNYLNTLKPAVVASFAMWIIYPLNIHFQKLKANKLSSNEHKSGSTEVTSKKLLSELKKEKYV